MPSPQAKPLHVSSLQRELLQRMVHRTTSAQRLVKRGHIILEAAEGISNTRIAQHQQVDYETVRRWRDRWHAAQACLQAIEATGKQKLLSQAIEVFLTDEQRPGAPAEDSVALNEQICTVCEVYEATPALAAQGTHVMSTDEMTGIQALEHLHPSLPMQPGHVERQEFEYQRHGTQSLIANLEIATGQVVTPSIGPTRTEADFAAHIAQTIQTDPQAPGSSSPINSTLISPKRWYVWWLRSVASRRTWASKAKAGLAPA